MTYRVAILGAGIGAEHLQAYLALPNRFEVAIVCDVNRARADQIAGPHGIPTSADMDAVLGDPTLDLVDICLPPHLHHQACLAVLTAGKQAICEKPLATSVAACDDLIAASTTSGKRIFPVFQYRFGLGTAQLRALQTAGLAGRCYAGSLETHWDRDAAYYAVDWRGTWAGEHGGALLGHAIHIHDMLTSILGPVAQVFADCATRVNEVEVEDCAALSIRMASGAPITSSVTLGAADNSSRMRLMFEGFTVESDTAPYALAAKNWQFTARAPRAQSEIDAVLAHVPDQQAGFVGLFGAIADALDGTDDQAVTLDDGKQSLEFVTACYASAHQNRPIALPLVKDHPFYTGWVPKTG